MQPTESGSSRLSRSKHRAGVLTSVVVLALAGGVCAFAQIEVPSAATPVPPSEIIQKMVQNNALRAAHLNYFTSRRHYHVDFHGLGRSMAADMDAQVTYHAGSGKTFQVLDQSGSHLLLNHVLKKLLETEQDDSRTQKATLSPANYNFQFQSVSLENGRRVYVFAVEPKVKNKLLYRGKIWIDAEDYAVVGVEAQPAENPSFWIKSTEIHHLYEKNGEFWLPQMNRSESKVRLGGTAMLTIDYGKYQFEEPQQPTQLTGDISGQQSLSSAQ
jgi:hypothetical protein